MIYFVRPVAGNLIKIGTTIRLSQRLKALEAEHGVKLTVLAVVDGGRDTEQRLHQRFAHLRVKNEWFSDDAELTGFIDSEARPWDGSDEVPLSALGTPTPISREAIKWARIASGYTGESMAEYVSRVVAERGREDADRLHAEATSPKKPRGKQS